MLETLFLNTCIFLNTSNAKPVFIEQIDSFELTIPMIWEEEAQVTPEVTPEVIGMLSNLEGGIPKQQAEVQAYREGDQAHGRDEEDQ